MSTGWKDLSSTGTIIGKEYYHKGWGVIIGTNWEVRIGAHDSLVLWESGESSSVDEAKKIVDDYFENIGKWE